MADTEETIEDIEGAAEEEETLEAGGPKRIQSPMLLQKESEHRLYRKKCHPSRRLSRSHCHILVWKASV